MDSLRMALTSEERSLDAKLSPKVNDNRGFDEAMVRSQRRKGLVLSLLR